jgi:uncharacterized membrane protein
VVTRGRITPASYWFVVCAHLLLAFTTIATSAQAQLPVGSWTFDEGFGTTASDSSGHGHTATLVNGVRWVIGPAGGAVSADAASQQYVSIPAIDLSDSTAVTVTLWVNRTYTTGGGHVLFEATADNRRSTDGFTFLPDDGTCHGIQVALQGNAGQTANCYSQPSSGVWHHFAVVFDKRQTAGDQVRVFIDGVLQVPSRSLLAATDANNFGDNPVYVFSRAGKTMFDSGAIADLNVYSAALTAAQVQQTYRTGSLVSLALSPANASISAGAQQQFMAMGTYADGSQRDLSNSVVWTSATSSVATVNSGGLASGVATGSTTVGASLGSLNAIAALQVTPPTGLLNSAAPAGGWQQGFDFRNTATYVTDPPGDTYVLPTMAYPTKSNGVTLGWVNTSLVQGRDRSISVDPRLAGINFATNGSPATFAVNLPSAGSYNLSLALGDDGWFECWVQCQVQFLDGNTVLATLTEGSINLGYFYDAKGNNWSAAAWPSNNLSQQVTLAGTLLTMVVGTSKPTGDFTTVAFLGVTQTNPPTFTVSASPASVSVQQGNQGTSTITTAINGGFNSAITLSASGMPSGTTVSFNPNPIPAPGSGNSTMTITVGASTPLGTYPITVTGNGGGIQQNTTVTLTVTAPPNFTISASPASLSVQQGNQGTSTITATISGGFNGAITLSASGMPSGTTVSFNPNPIPAPGSGGSTMTITVGASTPLGTYPITVTGNGGGIQQNTTVTLTVTAPPNFTISASPASLSVQQGNQGTSTITTTISGGFNGAITLSASGMPSGTTVSFNPNPIPAPGSGSSTMTITVGASTPTGTYPITVTGNGGGIQQNTTVTLTVTAPPNFTISASPASLSVQQGNQGTSTITTTISGGFNSAITLSASGMPSGMTVSFNPNPIPAPGSGSSTMTITVGASTPLGTYPITVTGNGGGIQQNTTVTLTVTAPPNFTISASPASLSVQQGNQGTSTITTAISGGFNSAITLSASGMPSGTTVSFNPNPIPAPGSGSSTMTITVGASTPLGTYPITVTGNGGGIQQNTTVTLTVTAPPNFTISASPASLSIQQGNQGTSTITTAISGGFNSAITLSASGAPSGTTVSFAPNPIPAPGSGSSTMTITVGASTALGTYPITVTGNGGGIQQNTTVTLTVAGSSITLDGNVHGVQDNGLSSSTTATVSIGTPTVGDLITCEVTFGAGTLVSVADNQNGTYAAGIPVHYNSTLTQWFGIYYKENVAGGPTSVTLTTSQASAYSAIACQAWKGVAASNSLDSSFAQLQDAVSTPNPTTGSNKTPSENGELIVAAVGLHTAGTPTAGANYTLIDGASTTQWWPEYWIQTAATGTNGPYTWPSDNWTDMMAAFKPPAIGSFTISASPSSLSVPQGNQGTSTITTTISGGFSNAISLSASGLPTGATVSFNPNPIAAPGSGSSTMTITVAASTPTGTYPITVTGNGGGIQQNATVTLTVTADPNFTISASPASLSILRGNQGASTITTTVYGGFNSAVSLSASGVPAGTTVSFSPNPIPAPGSGSSTMTITVGSSTETGTYPITVTGSGGGDQNNVTVTLTVVAQVALSWTASTSPGIAGYNMYRSTTSGGPYTKLNSSLISTTSYNDQTVQSGLTYYYVATAVNSQGEESAYSNQASASVQ